MVFDPVYSGKALFHFVRKILASPGGDSGFKSGDKVLFIHTGGVLGFYDKTDQLLPILSDVEVQKMKITTDSGGSTL